MITRLPTLEMELHDKLARLRSIIRLIESDKFRHAWGVADESAQLEAQNHIEWFQLEKLKQWIVKNAVDYSHLSTRQLKTLARNQGIPYYGRLNKCELIEKLIPRELDVSNEC